MKKLFFLFLFFISFFLVQGKVLAYELEVNCGATFCSLSAYSPIFSPDLKWTPGKTESREILIKNTDSLSKEIYIKARDHNTSTKELDSYMNITLIDGSARVWQGTLSDFIDAEKIKVKDIAGGEEDTLRIEAQLISSIPNDMQGKSSVFNFGFGFEGESGGSEDINDDEGSDSNSSNDSNSSGTSSSGSGSSEGVNSTSAEAGIQNPNLLTTAFNRVFGIFSGLEDEVEAAAVAGEKTNVENKKDVLGAGVSECRENYLWVLFLITQALFALLLFLKRFKNRLKLFLAGHSVLFGITIVAIYILSCLLWPILISIVIFGVPLTWLLYKNKTSK
jgi:hypothetical protein